MNALANQKFEIIGNEGRLADVPSRFVIDKLHREGFSGHLLLSLREKRKKIWFQQGEIFRVQTNLVPELFGHMMIERGWLNEADLKLCLDLQRDLFKKTQSLRLLGTWVSELHAIPEEEIRELHTIQSVNSILQSMTWDVGNFQINPMEVKGEQEILVKLGDVLASIQSLFEARDDYEAPLFKIIRPWTPKSQSVDLAKLPLWALLAGCQRTQAHGILSIRKQNRLYEIVIKNGLPLLLYEGSFGQPRQTLIVRRTSEEHERFFIDQVFRLFSFLTGSAHFRSLGENKGDRESYLQIVDASEAGLDSIEVMREEKPTQVTRSVKPEDLPLELKSSFLVRQTSMIKKTINRLLSFVKV